MMLQMKEVCLCLINFFCLALIVEAGSDKVKLTDVSVLTLYNGKFTNGRRLPPIPQLRCVGGTAGCSAFVPDVVQCTNKGSDGNDVQWECKTDMENKYKFGRVQVSCEGYDYPDDPYVLKGSCGLEYKIDLVSGGAGNIGGGYEKYYEQSPKRYGLVVVVIGVVVIYLLYKFCIAASNDDATSTTGGYRPTPDAPPPYPDSTAPPPAGFRPEYTSSSEDHTKRRTPQHEPTFDPPPYTQQQGAHYQQAPHTQTSSRFGGFWSGATLGGLAGYLFGSRNSNYPSGRGSSYYGGASGHSSTEYDSSSYHSSSGGGSSEGTSSGSRTTSGYGGTTRR